MNVIELLRSLKMESTLLNSKVKLKFTLELEASNLNKINYRKHKVGYRNLLLKTKTIKLKRNSKKSRNLLRINKIKNTKTQL